MKFYDAIDRYIVDMRSQGRLNSDSSERGYRSTLEAHAEDIGNRDPAKVGREDVKRTLRRWPNPNTQGTNRAKLVSFYDWAMEEGIRRDNPARATPRPRRRPAESYRLTHDEAVALLRSARGVRERRAIYVLVCAGLRNAELRGLKGAHFQRPGLIHVSADIAKGGGSAGCRSSLTWWPWRGKFGRTSAARSTCFRRSDIGIRD
jgi:integrase